MEKELKICILGFLLLFSILTVALIKPAQLQDQEAAMYIDPEVVTIDQLGKNFSVYVKVRNVHDVYLWQVAIRWNASILECINITLPEDHIFAGKNYFNVLEALIGQGTAYNNTEGWLAVGLSLLGEVSRVNVTDGVLCKIDFTTKAKGSTSLKLCSKAEPIIFLGYYQVWSYLQNSEQVGTTQEMEIEMYHGLVSVESKSPPVADFTYNPSEPHVDEGITFDASISYDPDNGTIVLYIWDFGDGNVQNTTEPTITHKYSKKGEYRVHLTVIDNDGLSNDKAKMITVKEKAEAEHFPTWLLTTVVVVIVLIILIVVIMRLRRKPEVEEEEGEET